MHPSTKCNCLLSFEHLSYGLVKLVKVPFMIVVCDFVRYCQFLRQWHL